MSRILMTDPEWNAIKEELKKLIEDYVMDSLPERVDDVVEKFNLRYNLTTERSKDELTFSWDLKINFGYIEHFLKKMRREGKSKK